MQGPTAQVIALVNYGNSVLAGGPVESFSADNTSLAYCEFVRFVDVKERDGTVELTPHSPDPRAWFERLRAEGARRILIHHEPQKEIEISAKIDGLSMRQPPERKLVGFVGGGGRWLIEVQTDNGSDYWEARWEVGDQERADRRIWRVTYGRIATGYQSSTEEDVDLVELRKGFATVLQAIGELARRSRLELFADAFEASLFTLNSSDPLAETVGPDLAPKNHLSLPASQLLATAQTAWVFGAMGSWNDVGVAPEDEASYDELSDYLYDYLNVAIVASVNSAARVPRTKTSEP